jgi:uncharacterized pyridoxamine 5'-phosphate oxidase family protein
MNNPRHIIEHKEEKVYFCCDGCKEKFERIRKNILETAQWA